MTGHVRIAKQRRPTTDGFRPAQLREKCMKTKILVYALPAIILVISHIAEAQQAKIPRIGILSTRSPGPLEIFDAFHQGLRNLGYVEGKNIITEYRFAEEKYDRLPALMSELVSLKPDVILTHTTPGALSLQRKRQ